MASGVPTGGNPTEVIEMSRIRAFYSVVQYVPHAGRSEAANVGVVIFVPETGRLEVRTTKSLDRVKQFFKPKKDERRRIELAIEAFRTRIETSQGEFGSAEEFNRFVAARADSVRMTTPRNVILNEGESKLNELYDELVGDGFADRRQARKAPKFPEAVSIIFDRLRASGRIWQPGQIVVPEIGHKLKIPFAYQNGRVNLILPRSLATEENADSNLQKLGFEGRLIHRHKVNDLDSKLVVVSSCEPAESTLERRYQEVLPDFDVRFVPFSESENFAREVEREAH